MSLWTAWGTQLTDDAGVSALVGSRVYAGHLPQNATLPAVSYSQVSEERFHNWGADTTVRQCVVQTDCWATTAAGARALSDAVVTAVSRTGWTTGSTVVSDVRVLTRLGPVLELPEETITRHYRFMVECEIDYTE